MLRSNRSVINTAVRMMLVEGGCNDIIAEGCKIIHEALAAEMDDEDFLIPDDSDDIVVDGPEPKEEQGTGNKGEKKEEQGTGNKEGRRRREKKEAKKEEQGTGNKEGRRRREKKEAAETDAADSGSLYTSQSEAKSRDLATSQSRDLALTPEQIRQGRSRVLRLIQQRTPPDIPTLVRACIDDGMTASDLATLTGLGYHTIAKCKTGAVTSTVAGRFQELFAFPRKTAAQSEEA